jgi:hypothetical protein
MKYIFTNLLLLLGVTSATSFEVSVQKRPKHLLPYVPEVVSTMLHNHDPHKYLSAF